MKNFETRCPANLERNAEIGIVNLKTLAAIPLSHVRHKHNMVPDRMTVLTVNPCYPPPPSPSQSVADFLVDKKRCGRDRWIDVAVGHRALASKAVEALTRALPRTLRPVAPDGPARLLPSVKYLSVVKHALTHALRGVLRLESSATEGSGGGGGGERQPTWVWDEAADEGPLRELLGPLLLPYVWLQAEDDAPSLIRLKRQLMAASLAMQRNAAPGDDGSGGCADPSLTSTVKEVHRWLMSVGSQLGALPERTFAEALGAPPTSAPAASAAAMCAAGLLDTRGVWLPIDADRPDAFPPCMAVRRAAPFYVNFFFVHAAEGIRRPAGGCPPPPSPPSL